MHIQMSIRHANEDDLDEDYIPEKDTSTESEVQSNLYNGDRQMNKALFAEWTAWICEEGDAETTRDDVSRFARGSRLLSVYESTQFMRANRRSKLLSV